MWSVFWAFRGRAVRNRYKEYIHALLIAVLWLVTPTVGAKDMPESRSFYLSFTYQPYDWTDQAFADTYSFIDANSDMIFHYFDDGVPWVESLKGSKFHDNVELQLNQRIAHRKGNQKVGVGANFLGKDRRSLAPYWGEKDNLARPGKWATLNINHPEVISAYIAYCRSLIKRFHPDYFVYGMEVNAALIAVDSKEFEALEKMISAVYAALRKEFADLPLVLTFVLLPEDDMHGRKPMIKRLLPFTDIYAVSLYPYLFDGIAGDSTQIPQNLISSVRGYIGDKPFAIAETGFNAKTWRILSKLIWIPGNEKSQAGYVDFLLHESNKQNALFVNWWVPRDLDALWAKMKASGADPILSQWNSTGLTDAEGNHRQGLSIWRSWLNKPIKSPRH